MKKSFIFLVAVLAVLLAGAQGLAPADDIAVARKAMRDGLWDIALMHAERVAAGGEESSEARMMILECYAQESRWQDILKVVYNWSDAKSDWLEYYHALALVKTGDPKAALAILDATNFTDPVYSKHVALLKASIASDSGDMGGALKIVRDTGFDSADNSAKMVAAGIMAAAGDRAGAEKLWRDVASVSNVNDQALAVAAVNLADATLLKIAYEKVRSVETRRYIGVSLGLVLIGKAETFDEGARVIRETVKDAPDADGAREAFVALADTYLHSGRYQEAAECYHTALETWPTLSKSFDVQEGRGWANRKLGKHEEALAAFSRAEENATNDVTRATAVLEQGDVLSDLNRGEEAMARYHTVLDKYPNTPACERLKEVVRIRELESRGRELYRAYDFEGAMKAFESLAALSPMRRPKVDYFKVLCLYGLGRDDEAAQKAKEIAEGSPDPVIRADATLWLAKFEYNRRNWSLSGKLFAAYSEMAPAAQFAPAALTWAARAAFAENDFKQAIALVTSLAERYPESPERFRGYLIQGEALIELSRFDEALLVLERTVSASGVPADEQLRAQILKADALMAMGADNTARYNQALATYQAVYRGESLDPGLKIIVAFKMGRTLEKLKQLEQATDMYYTGVVIAYREGRQRGVRYNEEARAVFSRAAFRLADIYESGGKELQAMRILELVVASDVPAADEAGKRIDRIKKKGRFL